MNKKYFGIATAVLLLTSLNLFAGSFYSRHGIGLIRYHDSVKAAGMGGISLAISDSVTVHFMNPANLGSVTLTHIQGEFSYDWSTIMLPSGEGELQDANINGISLLLPLKRGQAFAMGIQPYSRSDFVFEGDGSLTSTSFSETFRGDGGLDNIYFAYANKFGPVRLGLAADFYFGVINRNWQVSYNSSEFVETDDDRSTSMRGWGLHSGAQMQIGNWELGAAFGTPVDLTSETSLRTSTSTGEVGEVVEGTISLPFWFGTAAAYHPSRRMVLGAQFQTQMWGSIDAENLLGAQGVDSYSLALGTEYIPSLNPLDGFFKRIQLRLGFTISRLPYKDFLGNDIEEYTISSGFGIPFSRNYSRIDFAFEFGKRAFSEENPADETIFRFRASINGSEKWFQRRRSR